MRMFDFMGVAFIPESTIPSTPEEFSFSSYQFLL